MIIQYRKYQIIPADYTVNKFDLKEIGTSKRKSVIDENGVEIDGEEYEIYKS
jgi:hypothetical protein